MSWQERYTKALLVWITNRGGETWVFWLFLNGKMSSRWLYCKRDRTSALRAVSQWKFWPQSFYFYVIFILCTIEVLGIYSNSHLMWKMQAYCISFNVVVNTRLLSSKVAFCHNYCKKLNSNEHILRQTLKKSYCKYHVYRKTYAHITHTFKGDSFKERFIKRFWFQ